jgi:hypothetical protein
VKNHHCCQIKTRAGDNVRRPTPQLRRGGKIAGWIIPSATLALLPKCPVCVAAYVALATGIGISLPTATYLRAMLVVLCVASLAYLTARRLLTLLTPSVSSR